MRILQFINALSQGITFTKQYDLLVETVDGIDGPNVNIQSQNAPYQDGTTFIDALYDQRVISITGKILKRNLADIAAVKNILQQGLSVKLGMGLINFTYDGGVRQIPAIPSKVTLPNKLSTEPFQSFMIDFTCPSPYFIDPVINQVVMQTQTPLASFPKYFPAALSKIALNASMDLFNGGQVVTPIKIVFTGPATNPKFSNTTTGAFLKVIKTLATGDTLQVDTSFDKTTVIFTPSGGSPVNGMGYLSTAAISSVYPSFWQLAIGHNIVVFSDDASTTTDRAIITWQNRYIGL